MGSFLFCASALFGYMCLGYLISLILKRNDVADIAWGLGFVLLAWISYGLGQGGLVALIVSLFVTIWGLRLAWHIAKRNSKKEEDPRYAKWRREWTWFKTRSFFQVYMLQGVLLFMIALPIMVVNANSGTIDLFDPLFVLGMIVWVIGFGFEVIGDRQLRMFLSEPMNRGKIMQTGLWHYTRHPNYFGEVLLWWGIFVIAVQAPYGYLSLIGPLTITAIILFVSGVPMAERAFEGNTDFEEYKKRTSIFFPWFPKK